MRATVQNFLEPRVSIHTARSSKCVRLTRARTDRPIGYRPIWRSAPCRCKHLVFTGLYSEMLYSRGDHIVTKFGSDDGPQRNREIPSNITGTCAKYSTLLEPVVNALQSIALDVVKASQHVKRILQLLKSHRDNPERVTDEIIKDATVVAEKVGLEEDITSMPRIVGKQRHRSNHPAESSS
ncbi:hypothetical protein EVAR_94178_1 [Eumeta japonica]|uniref:Uncharacterized protein n=1 Tax=Eumeta variegata TaxID=151549 RepID=A0A4C1UP99_EUMVA|nr:hypothetical protein EVAR_94178_1 [Eumeta japonica]